MNSLEDYLTLRRLVDVLYDIQDVRLRTANRLRTMPKATRALYVDQLMGLEKELTKTIHGLLLEEPIYTEFLTKVRGIGPRISGCIVAETMIRFTKIPKDQVKEVPEPQRHLALKTEGGDYLVPSLRGIGAFPTVSKYWAWWGLHTVNGRAPKRQRGKRVNWSPKMRVLAWKIGKQFVMQGGRYRLVYEAYKARLLRERTPPQNCPYYEECKARLKKREEPACRLHIENMARRYAVKRFVSHLWEKWRVLEGLPVRPPYAVEKLGHGGWDHP